MTDAQRLPNLHQTSEALASLVEEAPDYGKVGLVATFHDGNISLIEKTAAVVIKAPKKAVL